MAIKILHYCWFGGNPLPNSTVEYMESWKKFLPDFEIKFWNENNFDVQSVTFVRDAYAAKKWAFVADYVRTYALYQDGGLYVDTDVEFIKPIDDLLSGSFMAFEKTDIVNPGLVLYADSPQLPFYKELLDTYNSIDFSVDNMYSITSPILYTELLSKKGLSKNGLLQSVEEFVVYPTDYFNPVGDVITTKPHFTENTRSIHHYDASWFSKIDLELIRMRKKYGEKRGRILFAFKHPIAALKRKRSNHK